MAARLPKALFRGSAAQSTLDAMVAKAVSTGAATSVDDLLRQVAQVHDRALFNALLAVLQLPHPTMMRSQADWERRWGRIIRPGQRPIILMFPWGPVEFVYDVSQTEPTEWAQPLPFDVQPFQMDVLAGAGVLLAALEEQLLRDGIRVDRTRVGTALAGHVHRAPEGIAGQPVIVAGEQIKKTIGWEVALNGALSPTEQLLTLAHELGHLLCGHVGADDGDKWPNRSALGHAEGELEAESVAALVFQRIAPGVTMPDYISGYFPDPTILSSVSWFYVTKAAERILTLLKESARLADGWLPATRFTDQDREALMRLLWQGAARMSH